MKEEILRSAMLLTPEGTLRLKNSNVIVFGLGGVGSYAAEALVRAGVGRLTVVDNDTVALSNINRQLIALHSTVGEYKTDAFARRALDINPELELTLRRDFVLQENINGFEWSSYDYAVDAVDTVQAKLAIAQACARHGVPLISCMGTGNKLEPERLQICDISQTRYCPLARVMRAELKKRGISSLRVVFSPEEPRKPLPLCAQSGRRATPGSVSFVPGCAGLLAAGEIVRVLSGLQSPPGPPVIKKN